MQKFKPKPETIVSKYGCLTLLNKLKSATNSTAAYDLSCWLLSNIHPWNHELNKHIREREELGSNDKDNDNDAFTKYILYINTLWCALKHFAGDSDQTALYSLYFLKEI